jgi:hypothetical protein
LILHYDGHTWVPTKTPVVGQAWLSGVACAGPDNLWAVGTQQPENGAFGPLILHFDGSAWAAVQPPGTAAPKNLSAVIALPDGTAWAAGLTPSGFQTSQIRLSRQSPTDQTSTSQSWDLQARPPGWARIRDRWQVAHAVRAVAIVFALGYLCAVILDRGVPPMPDAIKDRDN